MADILDFLSKASNGTAKVHELIDDVQMPIDVALKVVDYFESRGIIQVTQRDLKIMAAALEDDGDGFRFPDNRRRKQLRLGG